MGVVRFLPSEFNIGHVEYTKCDGVECKWSIYRVYDPILDYESYLAFKHKRERGREVRPAPRYESDNSWYYECDTKDEAKEWLIRNKLIK